MSLRGPKARGNPFSFRPLWGPGGASHHRGCGLPRRFAARNDILVSSALLPPLFGRRPNGGGGPRQRVGGGRLIFNCRGRPPCRPVGFAPQDQSPKNVIARAKGPWQSVLLPSALLPPLFGVSQMGEVARVSGPEGGRLIFNCRGRPVCRPLGFGSTGPVSEKCHCGGQRPVAIRSPSGPQSLPCLASAKWGRWPAPAGRRGPPQSAS